MANHTLLLPFGNHRAVLHASGSEYGAALRQMKLPVADFSFSGKVHKASVSGVRIGDLSVTAAASEPLLAKTLAEPHLAFIVPVLGAGKITQGARSVEWSAGRAVISNSHDVPLECLSGATSVITLRPSPEKLRQVLRGALDGDGDARRADDLMARMLVRGPMVDLGRNWSVDYHAAIRNVAQLIDNCDCDEALLARIGLEDVVNRLLAQLMVEQERAGQGEDGAMSIPRSVRAVDLICDHVRSRIGRPMSMSEMEDLTGLSGRALNYAFRARFDCSPQEWQRNFLLDHARLLLRDTNYTGSVKAMAYELGFSSASSFAAFYRQRFGERPSQTLARGVRAPDSARTD